MCFVYGKQTELTYDGSFSSIITGDLPFDLARDPSARQTYLVISESYICRYGDTEAAEVN